MQAQQSSIDHFAPEYDKDFSFSVVGKLQRQQVHSYLDKILTAPKHILEINCGTGEDMIWLAAKGHKVEASDISSEMISVCHQKIKKNDLSNVNAKVADIRTIKQHYPQNSFDLLFSNFGGLNCLKPDEIRNFSNQASVLLQKDREMIIVVMGRACLWEIFYFLTKFRFKQAFRRMNKNSVKANVNNFKQDVWYYSPADLKKMFSDHFDVKHVQPVGFFVPPSYLNPIIKKRQKLAGFLGNLDQKAAKIKITSNFADHFLMHLVKK